MQDFITAKERLDFRTKRELLKDILGSFGLIIVFYACLYLVN